MRTIKQILYLLLPITCIITGLSSCSDEYSEGLTATTDPHYLNSGSLSTYSANGGTQQLAIQSTGVTWNLSNSVDWISLSQTSGSENASVGVTASANTAYSDKGRAATMTLSGSGVTTRNITVNQESPSLALSVSPASVELSAADGSSASVAVTCNNTWTLSVADNTWLTATQNGNTITISAKENATGASRTNTVSVSSGSKIETVKITQKAANIAVSPQTLDFGYSTESQTVTLTSEVSWTAECQYSWIHLDKNSGAAGGSTITVTVDANSTESPRTGSFTVGNIPVTVNQKAFQTELAVTPESITFKGSKSNADLTVTSNSGWEYTVSENTWLTVTRTISGLNLSAGENANDATRSVFINFTSGTKTKQVEVKQLPASLEGLPDNINFGYEASSKTYTITSESAWKATTNNDWIELTPTSGNAGTTAFKVSVSENTSKEKRTNGSISINNKTISVTQDAVELTPSPTSLQFSEDGETLKLQITSNTNWTLTANKDWIVLDKTSGTGNATVNVTVAKNTSDPRDGRIRLESSNGIKEDIDVTQNGMGMQTVSIQPFSRDGSTLVYEPSSLQFSSWTATVESGVSWIHISPSSGSSSSKLTITVDKTTDVYDRSSYIDLTFGNGSKYRITINQYGAGIICSVTNYSFLAKGGTSEAITVQHVGDVKVTSSDSWLTAKLNGNLLTLTSTENLTGSARSATVTLQSVGSDNAITISVSQASQHGDIVINSYDGSETNALIDYVSSITLSATSATMYVGNTKTLTATVSPSNATNKNVTWSSSNTSVATVNIAGFVTAKAAGTAIITATASDGGGAKASCTVTVNEVKVSSIILGTTSATMYVGNTKTLTATVSPSNATNTNITWTSSNTSVATVSTSGVVTAKAAGTAVITATAADGGGAKASCTITVSVKVSSITLNATTATMTVGDTKTLTATVSPSNAANKNITWSSSNTSVATVNSSGVVTAISAGKILITATAADGGGAKATCILTVENSTPTAVDLGLSVKWATFNVGANAPEQYGDYYAWGETETKSNYAWSTYKWCKGSSTTMTKYCSESHYGTIDNKTTLDLEDDVAHIKWGGNWRMPTDGEMTELKSKCTWIWTTQNGVKGYNVTATNGNSIFLPAAGSRYETSRTNAGLRCLYWSSSLDTSASSCASEWMFYSNGLYHMQADRCYGLSVRAVCQ